MKRDSFLVFEVFGSNFCCACDRDFYGVILAKAMLPPGRLHLCFLLKKDWIDIRYFPFVQGSGNRFK